MLVGLFIFFLKFKLFNILVKDLKLGPLTRLFLVQKLHMENVVRFTNLYLDFVL